MPVLFSNIRHTALVPVLVLLVLLVQTPVAQESLIRQSLSIVCFLLAGSLMGGERVFAE